MMNYDETNQINNSESEDDNPDKCQEYEIIKTPDRENHSSCSYNFDEDNDEENYENDKISLITQAVLEEIKLKKPELFKTRLDDYSEHNIHHKFSNLLDNYLEMNHNKRYRFLIDNKLNFINKLKKLSKAVCNADKRDITLPQFKDIEISIMKNFYKQNKIA